MDTDGTWVFPREVGNGQYTFTFTQAVSGGAPTEPAVQLRLSPRPA